MIASEFDPSKPLCDATPQEIQFELLRRARHNALDGEKVLASLLAHRDLWRSFILAPLFVWTRDSDLPVLGLIVLRDLPDGYWHADTLYILTDSVEKARELVALNERDEWCGEPHAFDNPKEVQQSVGSWEEGLAVVRVWWD